MTAETTTKGPLVLAAAPSSIVGWPIVETPSGRSVASLTFMPADMGGAAEFNAENKERGEMMVAAYNSYLSHFGPEKAVEAAENDLLGEALASLREALETPGMIRGREHIAALLSRLPSSNGGGE